MLQILFLRKTKDIIEHCNLLFKNINSIKITITEIQNTIEIKF